MTIARILAGRSLLLAAITAAGLMAGAAANAQTLTFARIEAVVHERLSANRTYQPGDLLSQSDVEPIFNALLKLGFQAANNEELYDSLLRHNDPFVRTLRTTPGTKFMRAVATLPGAYDRLERLSWSKTGRAILEDLVARENGPQLFQAMLTPAGSKATEQALAADPRGKNFLLPTGHIHTEDELLACLKQAFEKQARAKGAARK